MKLVLLGTLTALTLAGSGILALAEEDTPPDPRDVTFETEDGATISARLFEPKGGSETKPTVIALHDQGGDRAMWGPLAEFLALRGVSVLTVDLRGHGASREAGGRMAETKVAEGDPALFAAMREDALAALAYARSTLLADGKSIGFVGSGVGGSIALEAAKKDTGVAGVLLVDPDPNACGIKVLNGLNRWDDRPVGLMAGEKVPRASLNKFARALSKQTRTEQVLVPDEKAKGAELVAKDGKGLRYAAQWLVSWLERPELDGKPYLGNVRQSSGPGHIVMAQSNQGMGMGPGGGLMASGYIAPGTIEGVFVLVHPDGKAKELDERSRRILFSPAGGKEIAMKVRVERWAGRSWKKADTFTLQHCGGFAKEAQLSCYEIWLSPGLLGVEPFTQAAVLSGLAVKGKPQWGDRDDAEDPSTWSVWSLD